jgi:thiol-disulfide isomerase/thioredoxin
MNKTFVWLLVLVGLGLLLVLLPFRPAELAGPAVGMSAPDFSAAAVGGQVVRLSELRGKVVVLDFWATWCPPCRAMIPHERELVEKFRDKPFAFISISADEDLSELREVLAGERMSWPNIQDGPDGPIQRLYEIQYFPTIYVLDKAGVIRFKDVSGPQLDRAVERLLAESH